MLANKAKWDTFNEQEMVDFKAAVFAHYRTTGYPFYAYTDVEKETKLLKLIEYEHENLIEGAMIRQSMHGLGLAWSYHPHHIEVPCNGMRTVRETFENDDLFKRVIDKRIKYGTNMTDAGIRKTLRSFSGTQGVSNFRPTAAACVYHQFVPQGGTTWDMSSGYGGRMLGAFACDRVGRYIGTDPCTPTFQGLQQMASDIQRIVPQRKLVIELHQLGSEVFKPEPNSIDCCFTSPPYFSTEKYSNEDTQSWKKYPGRSEWMYGFMADTLKNCCTGLKTGGILAINIEDTKQYPGMCHEFVKMCQTTGWDWIDTQQYALSQIIGAHHKGAFKYEPIFIFRKK